MTNETEAPDMKPCPFCGSENLGKLRRSPFQSEASIMCNDCYSSSASTEKWNTRADLSDVENAKAEQRGYASAMDAERKDADARIAELEANLARTIGYKEDYAAAFFKATGELQQQGDRCEKLEAKLAKAVKLMDLSVELAKWDTTLIDDVILFTAELKGTDQ